MTYTFRLERTPAWVYPPFIVICLLYVEALIRHEESHTFAGYVTSDRTSYRC
jgi:hypothetical protein